METSVAGQPAIAAELADRRPGEAAVVAAVAALDSIDVAAVVRDHLARFHSRRVVVVAAAAVAPVEELHGEREQRASPNHDGLVRCRHPHFPCRLEAVD